ncbi:MAG: hypothetical protein H7Y32_17570, partial [Chloroflexales bacterium]|nr:hypothetical protein [Chloroflexales bacterium]
DADTIAATLVREFGHEPQTAAVHAQDLLLRQQRAATDDDADAAPTATAPIPTTPSAATPQKRGNLAPQNRQSSAAAQASKRGNLAPQNRQSGAEKGQSGAENRQFPPQKPAIQRMPPNTAPAAARPKTPVAASYPMIPHDPPHDPPSSTRTKTREEEEVTPTEALLLKTGLYPSNARTLRDLPFEAVQAYVHLRRQQGWNAGAIKQGLEREQDQLCGRTPTTPAVPATQWHTSALTLCPAGSLPDDVTWVAALLRDGSPPAEALSLLARRIARRASAPGGRYVAA